MYIYSQIKNLMKTKLTLLIALTISVLLSSCKVEPKEIAYGNDHCYLCDMTVVDKTHAAEYVTKKGKSFPFDAIECMTRKINKAQNEAELAYILVADYSNPGKLVDAKTASYLISKAIKSPMGANLSAFATQEAAAKKHQEVGGKLYTWEELKEYFKK